MDRLRTRCPDRGESNGWDPGCEISVFGTARNIRLTAAECNGNPTPLGGRRLWQRGRGVMDGRSVLRPYNQSSLGGEEDGHVPGKAGTQQPRKRQCEAEGHGRCTNHN